jgi:hypothetical protein
MWVYVMVMWGNELYECNVDACGNEFGVKKIIKAIFVPSISISTKLL